MIASLDLAGVAEREALALRRDEAALERFRAGPLPRWDDARERLALWSDGFVDDPARLDTGTLSLWRDTPAPAGN